MKFTTLASLAAFARIISAAPTPDAAPVAEASEIEARRALPFRINVSSPHRQTLLPEYTLCNGHLTSIRADAAQYYFSDTPPFGVLYCSDNNSSGQIGFTSSIRDFAVLTPTASGSKKAYFSTFSLGDTKQLTFYNKSLGKAKWVLRGGEGGDQIDAEFGGFTTQDYIPVTLTAEF